MVSVGSKLLSIFRIRDAEDKNFKRRAGSLGRGGDTSTKLSLLDY